MPIKKLTISLGIILLLCGGNSVLADSRLKRQWLSPHYQNHILVGKIWSVEKKTFVSQRDVNVALKKARFVLLGETHPNKDHHLLQAEVLEVFAKSKQPPPRLVVEMIPDSYGEKLNQYRRANPSGAAALGAVLNWRKRGWGDWANYQPIFDVAFGYKLPIAPGNIDRKEIRKIGRKGTDHLSNEAKQELSLDFAYTKPQSTLLTNLLFASHCKLVPKSALSPMQLVQQVRDGKMAAGMLEAPAGTSAILIAGSGHVRNDWAVPRLLRAHEPKSQILTISFVEVTADNENPQEYEPISSGNRAVFDYMYFTPRSEIKDHCADLAKRFKKHKKEKRK